MFLISISVSFSAIRIYLVMVKLHETHIDG